MEMQGLVSGFTEYDSELSELVVRFEVISFNSFGSGGYSFSVSS